MNELSTIQQNTLIQVQKLPLDRNPAAVYLASLESPTSRRTMRQALDTIAGLLTGNADALACNWAAVRFQHTAAIRSKLAEEYAASTTNKFLSALRGTLKAAWQLGQMSAEDYHKAASVGGVKGETVPAGRELSGGEISALMQVCAQDPSPAGTRDAAIIALLYACGLRRAEVVALDLKDYDPETGQLVVRGKRNKERYAYPINGAARAMADWLLFRGGEPGALFRAINKGGRIRKGVMTTQAIYNILRKRAEEAGVKEFSPHDLRRTFVSDLLDAGADIVTVSKMAGHASVQTTARYDRRPEEAKRKAANLLHVPYQKREKVIHNH
jgi:site-specific recombinase XerD